MKCQAYFINLNVNEVEETTNYTYIEEGVIAKTKATAIRTRTEKTSSTTETTTASSTTGATARSLSAACSVATATLCSP
jgi:hypothetical protein